MPPSLLEYVHVLGVLLGGPPSGDPTTSHLLTIALSVSKAVRSLEAEGTACEKVSEEAESKAGKGPEDE